MIGLIVHLIAKPPSHREQGHSQEQQADTSRTTRALGAVLTAATQQKRAANSIRNENYGHGCVDQADSPRCIEQKVDAPANSVADDRYYNNYYSKSQ